MSPLNNKNCFMHVACLGIRCHSDLKLYHLSHDKHLWIYTNKQFQVSDQFFYLLHSGKQGAVFQVVPFVLVQSCVTKNLEKSFLSWFFLLRFPIVQLNHVWRNPCLAKNLNALGPYDPKFAVQPPGWLGLLHMCYWLVLLNVPLRRFLIPYDMTAWYTFDHKIKLK